MPQVLKIQPTIEVKIPDDQLLVNKIEYESLQDQSLVGKIWKLDDLRAWLGNKDVKWIKEFILYRPSFQKELEQMDSENLIHISSGRGDKWWFKASAMSEWIEDHWSQINWTGKVSH